MESTGELAWFRSEVVRSIFHPFDFARSLAREHFGLAGVLVALIAGAALAFAIDAMILTSKGFALFDFLPQVLIDSFFLGVRLAVTVAGVATVGHYAARLLRGRELTLDQAYTAFSFALSPLLLAPVAALLVVLAPDLLPIAGAVAALAVVRSIAGLAINLRALLPSVLAVVPFVVMVGTSALVMQDQISRFRFAGYAIAPQLIADFTATPMTGTVFEAAGEELVAIYHSHPVSQPYPSPTDRAEAHYPDAFYILVSLRTGEAEVRAFTIDADEFVREVPVAVERRGLARLLSNAPRRSD